MKILHISAECYPFAKVGGLADVVGALPKYQNELGHDGSVVMPFYALDNIAKHTFKTIYKSTVSLGDETVNYTIKKVTSADIGFDVFFIDVPEYINKPYVYSTDDTERFLVFQIAILDWVCQSKKLPDVIHHHDHHTGFIPFMMSHCEDFNKLKETPSILTIHNAQYQGQFSHDRLELIPKFNTKHIGLLDWDGLINPLATAIKCAWRVTTVSPNYMEEMKVRANGLESLIAHESDKCVGVLNGIDTEVWNPETDNHLIKNYTTRNRKSGKQASKKALCKRFNLNVDLPLIVFIGRLVYEKGTDLFSEAFKKTLPKAQVNLLVLGSGDNTTEAELEALKTEFQGKYNAFIGYDEALSHQMYAGADFLLMPSRVEPCGLNQLYSLRYGTIPIVSQVGGLKDTVIDIENDGFGICIDEVSVDAISKGIKRAEDFYQNQKQFRSTRLHIMKIDHSWTVSAKDYINLYTTLIDAL